MPERKLADHIRDAIRLRGYSIRTEKAYLDCSLTPTDTSGTIAVAQPTSSPGGADGRHVDYPRCCRDRPADGTPGASQGCAGAGPRLRDSDDCRRRRHVGWPSSRTGGADDA